MKEVRKNRSVPVLIILAIIIGLSVLGSRSGLVLSEEAYAGHIKPQIVEDFSDKEPEPWINASASSEFVKTSNLANNLAYLPVMMSPGTPYEAGVLLVSFETSVDAEFVDLLANTYGAVYSEPIEGTGIYRWEFPRGSNIDSIQKSVTEDPAVRYAEPNYLIQLFDSRATPNDPMLPGQWALAKIDALRAWDLTRGSREVVIAIVDTGIDTNHPDLRGKLTPQNTWFDYGDQDNDPKDYYGHGTHCAGIAAAASNNSIGVSGLSWNALIMPIKVFPDGSGSATSVAVARGILHAVNQDADIVSLSLGSATPSKVIEDAIGYGNRKGVIIVAAAGNSNTSAPHYPAAFNNVISVASTASDDKKSSFSNYGSWVDISAPGTSILSTMPTYEVYMNKRGYSRNYEKLSGTSMAAPYVAGLASLVVARNPSWGPVQVENHIKGQSDGIDGLNPRYASLLGSGRINAYRAVQATSAPTATPTSTTATKTPVPTATNTPIPTPTQTPTRTQMPDLVVTDLTIKSISTNSISYQYTIKNVGMAPANLDGPTTAHYDNVQVQAYLSQDMVFNNEGDSPAGGTILGLSPLGYLYPGETFTGSFSASADNPSGWNYLTLKVDWGKVVDESNEINNTIASPMP